MINPKLNAEGYADPTAYHGMKEVVREENEADKRTCDLIKVLKFIIRLCNFELIEHIHVKDLKSGRKYK